jgi:hypothetical protein
MTINGDDDVGFKYKEHEFSRVEVVVEDGDLTDQVLRIQEFIDDLEITWGTQHRGEMFDILCDLKRHLDCVFDDPYQVIYHRGGNRYITIEDAPFQLTI